MSMFFLTPQVEEQLPVTLLATTRRASSLALWYAASKGCVFIILLLEAWRSDIPLTKQRSHSGKQWTIV
jgi:hypothetical protein